MNGLILSLLLLCGGQSLERSKYVSQIHIDVLRKVVYFQGGETELFAHYKKLIDIRRNEFGSATHITIKGEHLDYFEFIGQTIGVYDVEDYDTTFYFEYSKLPEHLVDMLKAEHEEYMKSSLILIDVDIDDNNREFIQLILDALILEHNIDADIAVHHLDVLCRIDLNEEYEINMNLREGLHRPYLKEGFYFPYFHNDHQTMFNTDYLSKYKEIRKK